MQEQPYEHMLLKWRQHHLVRFLPLIGNPFIVPIGLQQLLKQLSILQKRQNQKHQDVNSYAYKYSVSTLKELHSPYGKFSTRQIQRARYHARTIGPS